MEEYQKRKLLEAGIDVDSGMERFLENEELYLKFLMKFPADENYQGILDTMEKNECSEAFRCAHTLKGLAGNLSFNYLYQSLIPFVEELRIGNWAGANELRPDIEKSYQVTVEALKALT